MRVADLRVLGRATQGVRLINLRETDEIASITKVDSVEDEETADGETELSAPEATNETPSTENNEQ
jgi:DNA gyrase subunit A